MKPAVRIVAAITLFIVSLAASAAVTESDMLGKAAQPSAAQRTVLIGPETRWVTVEHGEVVKFVANGQEFAWAFTGMSSSFDLSRVAPAGALDRSPKVYVWPNAQDLADR